MTKLNGEAFKRFLGDDVLWKTDRHRGQGLWVDDEVLMVARPGEPERRWTDTVFDDLPDDATVRIESGHVASSEGYQGELTDFATAWLDQERRRLEALALRAACPDGNDVPPPRRRM